MNDIKLLQSNIDKLERVILGLHEYSDEDIETVQYMKRLSAILVDCVGAENDEEQS